MAKYKKAEIEITAKDKTKRGIKSAEKSVGGLTKSIKRYGLQVGAATAAVYGAIKVAQDLVNAYKIQEQAEAKLAGAIKATGKQTSINIDHLKRYAAQLQKVTTYGDETTLSAMALLQNLGDLNEKGIKQLIPGIQDMATAMGLDLTMAAGLVGKTLGSTTNALSRYGIVIDMTGTKQEKMAELTKQMTEKFGGMSKTVADTATGSMVQMKNAVGDLKETLGGLIANSLKPAVSWFTKLAIKINDNIKQSQKLKGVIRAQGGAEGTDVFGFGTMMNPNATAKNYGIESTADWLKRYKQNAEAAGAVVEENGKKVIKLTKDQQTYVTALTTLQEKIKQANELHKIYGKAYDAQAAKTDALKAAIQSLVEKGFTAEGSGIKSLIKLYGDLLEQKKATLSISDMARGHGTGVMAVNPAATGNGTIKTMADFTVPSGHGGSQPLTLAGHGGGVASVATTGQKIAQFFQPLMDIFGKFGGGLMKMIGSLSSVKAILDPLTTILQGVMNVLAPVINEILKPLQGALIVFGELIGHILAPILKALSPAIEWLAKAFIWVYNKVLVPVGNGILWIADKLMKELDALSRPFRFLGDLLIWVAKVVGTFGKNVGIAIWNVTHPFSQKGYAAGPGAFSSNAFSAPLRGLNYQKLNTIDMSTLNNAGATAQGTGTTGAGANYTAGRAQTFNIYINTEAVVGEDGMDQFVLMIRNRIEQLQAVGL